MPRAVLAVILAAATAPAGEVRGVWAARNNLGSRAEIRAMMRQLADANFNTAYVNVWSQGFPLWRSALFEKETGVPIDPLFAGRDALQECVDEGRAAGIAIIPWFEYGFIGGWSGRRAGADGRGLIFDAHPDWTAKTLAGETRFPLADGTFFTWMAATRPDLQEFLLGLVEEVQRNYDVPGVQFDRARYPQLDCGYDEFTQELYAREHDGRTPPANAADPAWVRWRADKMNEFVARLHRRLKDADWRALSTNAPGVYPFAYANFAQDYPGWARQGSLDFVTPQVYRRDVESFEQELDRQIQAVGGASRLVPGVDITNSRDPAVLVRMLESVRARKLSGAVIWVYHALVETGAMEVIKSNVYKEKEGPPWRATATLPAN